MNKSILNGANAPAQPDYMSGVGDQDEFGQGMDGGGFPRLAFKGSRFRLRQGEDETVLEETKLDVIVLRDYPAISRLFFQDGYDSDGGSRPSCASADGEAPIASAAYPQSNTCATCKQNEKGSAVTDDGRKSRACSFYKRLVIMIVGYEDVGPVVVDVKSMSLFGDSRPNDDQWTLKTYFRRLHSNNCKPFQIVTQIAFDIDSSVPKVLFRALSWVDEGAFTEHVAPLIGTPDGQLQLEEMADTNSVRTGDADGDAAPASGVLAQDKPKHLEAPTPDAEPTPAAEPSKEMTPQQKAAVTRKANAAKKKQEAAEAAAAPPAPEPTPEPEPEPAEVGTADAEMEKALQDFGF